MSRRCSSTDRLRRRTKPVVAAATRPAGTRSSVKESRATSTLDRASAVTDTNSVQYGLCAALRPPTCWSAAGRCPIAGHTHDSGLVLVTRDDTSVGGDPDVVQNCSLCRHMAAAAAGVDQTSVISGHHTVDATDDNAVAGDGQLDRY